MSKLLIADQPLQVLPQLAKLIGLNEALFLQQLHYWLQRSTNEHDERKWVYNTFEEWQAQFPFWSQRTMQRIAASLVKQELLVVHQFKKADWDRRNWYSIEYGKLREIAQTATIIDSDKLSSSIPPNRHLLEDDKTASSYTETTTETTNTEEIPLPFASPEFLDAWGDYTQARKEKRQRVTPTIRKALCKKMLGWGERRSVVALIHSTGYTGLYEPNGRSYEHPNAARPGKIIV